MNIKIQGGGSGKYANKGSCKGVAGYLEHEDVKRISQGQELQGFFDQERNFVSRAEVEFKIDHNKAKLCCDDSKFYMITVSPSQEELAKLGGTEQERIAGFKAYIRENVMQSYAEGFGKNLNRENILYFGKIHLERTGQSGDQMHAHIIVSRKDLDNRLKLSPMTNHRGSGRGAVKSGFERVSFYEKCEQSFDKRFGYERGLEQSIQCRNDIKNGALEDIAKLAVKSVTNELTRAIPGLGIVKTIKTVISITKGKDKGMSW